MKLGLNRLQRIVCCIFGLLALVLTVMILDYLAHHTGGSMLWPVVSLALSAGCFFVASSD